MSFPQAQRTSGVPTATVAKEPNLNDDLNTALSVDFKFTGSYYHRSVEQNAPNPGLTIKGVGLVGLPLGERDAQAIIAQAAQAPFGKGAETVVDTKVRDTWEVEPSAISFENARWKAWVEDIALKTVWSSLGVAKYSTRPRCELYKLLLYQKGSHFLPHQDTEKSPGMFATVVIVLPSRFQGGQVHVSHAGQSAVLDVSVGSALNTSVLAWYTDVMHEVKPITSGYRLALSYNLIHTSPNTPQPSLPDMHGMLDGLRKPLEQWNSGLYKKLPNPPFVLHMFSHQYSQYDLNRGVESLKGRDAHLFAHLRPVLRDTGFSLCFANILKNEKGSADDDGRSEYDNMWGKRRRRGYDSYEPEDRDDDEHVSMLEVYESSLVLTHLVLVDEDDDVMELPVDEYQVNDNAVVPKNAFKKLKPDEQEYEGYMGNYAGELEHWYNRSALLIFRKEDEARIITKICGSNAVLDLIGEEDGPTPTALKLVTAVLAHSPSTSDASNILEYAISWEHHETWNKAIPYVTDDNAIKNNVSEAIETFDFEVIKPGIVDLVNRQKELQRRLDVAVLLVSCLGENRQKAWLKDLTADVLKSYASASSLDVPTLVRLAREGEANTLLSTVIPRTKAKAGTFDFHFALGSALREAETSLSEDEISSGLGVALRDCARECLVAAITHWKTRPPEPKKTKQQGTSSNTQAATLQLVQNRLGSIAKLAMSMQEDGLYVGLFNEAGVGFQMEVLAAVKPCIEGPSPPWVKEIMQRALDTYPASSPAVSQVPTLVWIAEEIGAAAVEKLISEKISHSGSSLFLIALTKAFHERHLVLLTSPGTPEETKSAFRRVVSLSALSAIPRWEAGLVVARPQPNHYSSWNTANSSPNAKVKRILEIVELCFTIGDFAPCSALFALLNQVPSKTTAADRFRDVHTPLIPLLKDVLKQHGQLIYTEPFKSFFKGTICLYLARILGATAFPPHPIALPTAPIGCEWKHCKECKDLDTWFTSTTTPSGTAYRLKSSGDRRSHIEDILRKHGVAHLVVTTTETVGRPYTLVVSKRPELVVALAWRVVQGEAVAFVRSVAEDEGALKMVMGERYMDAMAAMHGMAVFSLGEVDGVPGQVMDVDMSMAGSLDATASSSRVASGSGQQQPAQATAMVAGVKRKKSAPTNVIGVIDLT